MTQLLNYRNNKVCSHRTLQNANENKKSGLEKVVLCGMSGVRHQLFFFSPHSHIHTFIHIYIFDITVLIVFVFIRWLIGPQKLKEEKLLCVIVPHHHRSYQMDKIALEVRQKSRLFFLLNKNRRDYITVYSIWWSY